MKSLRGQFLVASTHLKDPNFYRSVVLLVQHDEEGALGLILNRPTGRTVRDALKLVVEDPPSACDDEIFLGGPVRGPICVVHTDEQRGNLEILDGLYYTVEEELVNDFLQEPGRRRVFIGYSGWGPDQLEGELEAGGWLLAPATIDEVFEDPEDQWRQVSRRIGQEFLSATIKPRILPEDPSLN